MIPCDQKVTKKLSFELDLTLVTLAFGLVYTLNERHLTTSFKNECVSAEYP